MKHTLLAFMILILAGVSSCQEAQKTVELSVMTFNIRYDNPEDGVNNWNIRKQTVGEMLLNYDCDIIGAQEVLNNQLEDLKQMLPEYTAVGVGREDGFTKGEYSAVLYKKNKFDLIDEGTFWLSETPDIAGSKGWDGACERVATWLHLREVKTDKEFLFINTHLDHVGVEARRNGVNLLQDKAFELSKGLPIIATGDFNANPKSDVFANVTNKTKEHYWVHAKDIAVKSEGLEWSFHDFDKLNMKRRELIDYIFVSPTVKVSYYEVTPIRFNNVLVSDHAPVIATIHI